MEEVLSLLLLAIVILGPIEAYHRQEQDAYAANKGSSAATRTAVGQGARNWWLSPTSPSLCRTATAKEPGK